MNQFSFLRNIIAEGMAIAKNRVSLELACSGSKVSFPGPCTYENGWTLPDEWTVRQLVGHGYLIYLEELPQPAGWMSLAGLDLKRNQKGELELTDAPVSAVLTESGEIADGSCMLKYCCNSEERVVKLLIGKEPVKFQDLSWAKDFPLADLDGVQTPPTPCSSDTS